MTMARASATRRAMPPDSSAGMSRAAPRSPTACSLVSTSWRTSDSGSFVCARTGNATFSYTSTSVSSAPFWNNMPMRRRSANSSLRDMVETSSPNTRTLPRSACRLAGDEPQQRGLAGARRPHERGDAAAARGDVEAVENRAAADGVAHIANLNNGIAGLRRRSVAFFGATRSSVHVVRLAERPRRIAKGHPPGFLKH